MQKKSARKALRFLEPWAQSLKKLGQLKKNDRERKKTDEDLNISYMLGHGLLCVCVLVGKTTTKSWTFNKDKFVKNLFLEHASTVKMGNQIQGHSEENVEYFRQ